MACLRGKQIYAVPHRRYFHQQPRAPEWRRVEGGQDHGLREVYDTERHLLYVACTRAREKLAQLHTQRTILTELQGRDDLVRMA